MLKRLVNAAWLRTRTYAALITARRDSQRRLQALQARRILVVCYGNIYRSAFVGALLHARLGGRAEIRSAGFHSTAGRPSPARHVQLSERYGVSLHAHRSAVITAADVEWADVILLMDRHNWAALRRLGAAQRKLIWLGSLIPGPVEISDPYTLDDAAAERIVIRLRDASEQLVALLHGRKQTRS